MRVWDINLEIINVENKDFIPSLQGVGFQPEPNAISTVCFQFSDFIGETEVQRTICYQQRPSTLGYNYVRMQTRVECFGVRVLHGLQVFLLTLINTESFPWTR